MLRRNSRLSEELIQCVIYDGNVEDAKLMMGFIADGQAAPRMVDERDQRFGIDSAKKRRNLADIERPEVLPGADAWQKGKVFQIEDPTGAHVHH